MRSKNFIRWCNSPPKNEYTETVTLLLPNDLEGNCIALRGYHKGCDNTQLCIVVLSVNNGLPVRAVELSLDSIFYMKSNVEYVGKKVYYGGQYRRMLQSAEYVFCLGPQHDLNKIAYRYGFDKAGFGEVIRI